MVGPEGPLGRGALAGHRRGHRLGVDLVEGKVAVGEAEPPFPGHGLEGGEDLPGEALAVGALEVGEDPDHHPLLPEDVPVLPEEGLLCEEGPHLHLGPGPHGELEEEGALHVELHGAPAEEGLVLPVPGHEALGVARHPRGRGEDPAHEACVHRALVAHGVEAAGPGLRLDPGPFRQGAGGEALQGAAIWAQAAPRPRRRTARRFIA